MPEFLVHRLVAAEFVEVRDWYAGQSPWAAEHFVRRFETALKSVALHPTAHAPWQSAFRRVRLTRFPYLLIFHADQQRIAVLALVHERREPRRVVKKLGARKAAF